MGGTLARHAGRHGFEPHTTRVLAAYICKRCEIEGQDQEESPGRVFCWNCEDEAMITARIVTAGLARQREGLHGRRAAATIPQQPHNVLATLI